MTYTTVRFETQRSGRRSIVGALAITTAAFACANRDLDQRDLGNTGSQLTSDEAPPTGDRSPIISVGEGRVDPFIEGHWVGHAENPFAPSGPDGERPIYAFPSGSTDITLDLVVPEGAYPGGTITFGSGPVPTPAAGVPYPPNTTRMVYMSTGTLDIQLAPLEGFTYPLEEAISRTTGDVGLAGGALSLGFFPNAAYARWCTLQTPRATDGNPAYNCLNVTNNPGDRCGFLYEDGSEEHYDCDLANLCLATNVCSCTETECSAARMQANQLWFVRDGEDLVATMAGGVFDYGSAARYMPVGTLRFERVTTNE